MDFSKFKYEQEKKERQAKKHQTFIKLKEIRVKPKIGEHDYQVKLRKAVMFLSRGDKLRIVLTFRGREMLRQNLGRQRMDGMIEDLKEYGHLEGSSRMMGRRLMVVLSPTHSAPHRQ